jgi:hypothetical protein
LEIESFSVAAVQINPAIPSWSVARSLHAASQCSPDFDRYYNINALLVHFEKTIANHEAAYSWLRTVPQIWKEK